MRLHQSIVSRKFYLPHESSRISFHFDFQLWEETISLMIPLEIGYRQRRWCQTEPNRNNAHSVCAHLSVLCRWKRPLHHRMAICFPNCVHVVMENILTFEARECWLLRNSVFINSTCTNCSVNFISFRMLFARNFAAECFLRAQREIFARKFQGKLNVFCWTSWYPRSSIYFFRSAMSRSQNLKENANDLRFYLHIG